jgi:glycosyltransferase involved in cell wall biosynthesis
MKILFIHQNFPGQFKHLAPVLAAIPGNEVLALSGRTDLPERWQGVRMVSWKAARGSTSGIHPWVSDFETKVIRGEAAFHAARRLRAEGFVPDVIVAHPGWGESLFVKEVWPNARLGIYCEFFYHAEGADVGFDPEFPVDAAIACRMRMKNVNNLLHFDLAAAGMAPTHWQASTFPQLFRDRVSVVHDGIDTARLQPNAGVELTLNGQLRLTRKDEVITFVNRNLEPYRGYHVFMRALPEILARRPQARVLIVGGDQVSYGARPPEGQTWKDIFASEVRPRIAAADWGRIHFLGNIPYDHFIPLLQLSTVHVYLTYPFVLSWSLLEAMSAGCAIVASDTAPLHEAIRDGDTGRLVNFFDPSSLAQSVCELLADREQREVLGRRAREFALAHYDLGAVCLPRQIQWVNALGEA